jgi:hypothetical protein
VFGTADVEAVAETAMALLDGTGVRMLIHDPAMELDRACALVLSRELGGRPACSHLSPSGDSLNGRSAFGRRRDRV